MTLSLRSKIALIGSGAILLAILTVVSVLGHIFKESYTEALESRSVAVARSLSLQLERIVQLGIRPTELSGFEAQLTEAVSAYDDISGAFMATQDGEIVAHSLHATPQDLLTDAALLAALRSGQAQVVNTLINKTQFYVALEPVQTPPDFTPVVVGVVLDSAALLKDIHTLQAAGWGAGLLALLGGVALLISATTRFISRPISAFVATMARISKEGGDLSLRAKRRSDDEFGVMVDGFNTLLDQLAQRDAALVQAQQTADAANRAKSQFLATVSHELRTPMHAILGMNELLLRTELNTKQLRFASTVHQSARNLLVQINDILDFSRIEAGKLELEDVRFSLRALIEEVVNLLAVQAQRTGLDLAWFVSKAVPELATGDSARIRQMLTNLIGNALKFTHKGGVLVEVTQDGACTRFSVSDTGIGVETDLVPQLFEPFRQADSSFSRRYGGSGLGLAIVKELATAMGGEVGGSGAPGEGSCFWFELRLGADAIIAQAVNPMLGRMVVLVSDLPMTSRAIIACAGEQGIHIEEQPIIQDLNDGSSQAATRVTKPDCVPILAMQDAQRVSSQLAAFQPSPRHAVIIGTDAESIEKAHTHLSLPLNTDKLIQQLIQVCAIGYTSGSS